MDELLNRTQMKHISDKAMKQLDETRIKTIEEAKLLANKSKYKEIIQKLKEELLLDKEFERYIKNYSMAQFQVLEEAFKEFALKLHQFSGFMISFYGIFDNQQLLKYVKFYDSSLAFALDYSIYVNPMHRYLNYIT
jgi:oligoribonuclease NrnB/cAMP/cGMP phosphodiesterase (DHH superfamily)